MSRILKLLPALLLGIFFLGTVHAQNNRAALIIGIEHYRNPVTAPSLLGVPADMDRVTMITKRSNAMRVYFPMMRN